MRWPSFPTLNRTGYAVAVLPAMNRLGYAVAVLPALNRTGYMQKKNE